MSSQNNTRKLFARAARVAASGLLAFALLAATVPSGALSASHACMMACCEGKPAHLAGECESVSCHVSLPPADAKQEAAPESHGEDAHARHAEAARDESARAAQATGDGHAHAAHAPQGDAHAGHSAPGVSVSAASDEAADARAEKRTQGAGTQGAETVPPGAGVSRRAGSGGRQSEGAGRVASATHASVSKPCPAECGAAANGFGGRVKQKDAPLVQSYQPRPPPQACADELTQNLSAVSDQRRGNSRPRAPPQRSR